MPSGDPQATVGEEQQGGDTSVSLIPSVSKITNERDDGAKLLWVTIMGELARDEDDFKHRVAVVDSVLKQKQDIDWLEGVEAESVIPFDQIKDNYVSLHIPSRCRPFYWCSHRFYFILALARM